MRVRPERRPDQSLWYRRVGPARALGNATTDGAASVSGSMKGPAVTVIGEQSHAAGDAERAIRAVLGRPAGRLDEHCRPPAQPPLEPGAPWSDEFEIAGSRMGVSAFRPREYRARQQGRGVRGVRSESQAPAAEPTRPYRIPRRAPRSPARGGLGRSAAADLPVVEREILTLLHASNPGVRGLFRNQRSPCGHRSPGTGRQRRRSQV